MIVPFLMVCVLVVVVIFYGIPNSSYSTKPEARSRTY